MWTLRKLAALLLTAWMVAGCCESPTKPGPDVVYLGQSFVLKAIQTVEVSGEEMKISLRDVGADRRCSPDAYCEWPGTVGITLLVVKKKLQDQLVHLDLLAGADSATLDLFSVDAIGYNFRFEEFYPYRWDDMSRNKLQTPPAPPWQAMLKITKRSPRPPFDGKVTITDRQPTTFNLDYFQLDSARMKGDTLAVRVSYSGGCIQHYFFLSMSPAQFLESLPPQANLYVRHFANEDACDSWISRTLYFDVSDIKRLYGRLYGRFDPIRLNVYDYFVSEP